MTLEIAFVIGLIVLAFILFVTEKFSLDVTALLILTILFLGGFLSVDEAISGFSNPAVIVISLLFVLSQLRNMKVNFFHYHLDLLKQKEQQSQKCEH